MRHASFSTVTQGPLGPHAYANFRLQCRPDLCLCSTSVLQIMSFCMPRSVFLRHIYTSDLSVTLNTALSLSVSLSGFSGSKFQAFCPRSITFFLSAFLGTGETRTDIMQTQHFLFICFSFTDHSISKALLRHPLDWDCFQFVALIT